jgi:uncharacterized delta-60 repeat protein
MMPDRRELSQRLGKAADRSPTELRARFASEMGDVNAASTRPADDGAQRSRGWSGFGMRLLVKACLRRRVAAVGVAVSLAAVAGGAASAAPGDLDPGFGGASNGRVEFDLGGSNTLLQGLAVQPGGGIVSVGTADGGATPDAVAYRLRADGTPDSSFGRVTLPGPTDADERAHAAVAQPDGKIVVAGSVTDAGGFSDIAVWRLTRTGTLDTSFGTNGLLTYGRNDENEAAVDVTLDPQGRIVAAGVRVVGVDPDLAVVRLTSEGVLDATFNNGQPIFAPNHTGVDLARSVAVQPDGKILVAGDYAGVVEDPVLRITPGTATTDAVLDDGFGGGDGIAEVPGTLYMPSPVVAVGADGTILLIGQVLTPGGSQDGTVVRLGGSGTVDASYGSATGAHIDVNDGLETLEALMVLPGGGAAVVGYDGSRAFLAKLRATGAPDLDMGSGGVKTLPGAVQARTARAATLPDGRIIIGGNSTDTTGVAYRLMGELRAPSCAGERATIVGTAASDHLVGTHRVDVIAGLGGSDQITGLGKGDLVCGGAGGDTVSGGAGADRLYGQAGRDTLSGGKGRDVLRGGPGHDTLAGGPGHDTLTP